VRTSLFGPDAPRFTSLVSYRAVVPRAAAEAANLDSFTKWWGPTPDVQVVVFPLTRGEEVFVFATTPQDDWREESWTLPGDVEELRYVYRDFHADVRALLAACESVTKSALYVREPMERWSQGAVTILGDAAHPMVPFMAQGACMAIEDAVVLSRALEDANPAGLPAALARYEAARRDRTARVQRGSLANDWLKGQGNADWVYGYDAWAISLDEPAAMAGQKPADKGERR
jgi:salicylate hydroxylase